MQASPRDRQSGGLSSTALLAPTRLGLGLLVASWLVTRAVLFASTLSGAVPLDIVAYARWAEAALGGNSPATDTAFVYPSGSTLVFLAPRLLAPDTYFRAFTLLAAAMDALILVALVWFVRRRASGWVAPWAWVLMGFAAGPLMYERYDLFAALLGVVAVLTLGRPAFSGAVAGVGLLVKLWPEIAVLGLPRDRMLRGLVANVSVVVVGWALLQVVFGDSLGFVANVMNKGVSVEAVAAYPFLVLRAVFASHGVTGQFGSWEVIGPGVPLAATISTAIGVALLLTLFVLRLRGRLDHVAPGDLVLLGVLIFVATHKINSLQYGVWIAAMTAAALAYGASRAQGPAVLLTLMLFVSDQVIWEQFVPFISGNPLLIGMQGLRLALLLAAIAWLAWSMWTQRPRVSGKPDAVDEGTHAPSQAAAH